jgi:hypothetical protein
MPPKPPGSLTPLLGQGLSAPQPEDHAAGLEEDDVVCGLGASTPTEGLVESTGACQIGDPERY